MDCWFKIMIYLVANQWGLIFHQFLLEKTWCHIVIPKNYTSVKLAVNEIRIRPLNYRLFILVTSI